MAFQIVITDYGIYATRGGRLAFISKTEQHSNGVLYLGYLLTIAKGKAEHEWHAWTVDGRCNSYGRELDIIEKV